MIEMEGVTKKYGNLTALRDVSFQIRKNETVGLLGRNGAGKTTLLNLMTGYFPPDAGSVRIAGKSMLDEAAACKRMIGYLPEKPPLYDEMTVEEYLRFVCELREVKKQGIRAHVDEILTLCGLQEVRGRLLGHLIRALSSEHTVIFSSHILSEVQQACTRVLILDEGRLVMDYDALRPQSGKLSLRLSVAGDEEKVMNRLRRLDGISGAEILPALEAGVTEARIETDRGADGGAALDRIFRTLADSGLPVRMMREEKENLEEVFLRSISQ